MKRHIAIKLWCASLLVFGGVLTACKKKSRELTTVNFHLYNPVTNEGFNGVKVKILQQKQKGSGLNVTFETETIWEGTTDANGKASHSFKCYNSNKYFYWPTIDESFYYDPNIEIVKQPDYQDDLDKNNENNVDYLAIQSVYAIFWYKNANCFDQTDKCRIRSREFTLWAGVWEDWGGWFPQSGSGYYEGCYELLPPSANLQKQKILQFQFEVTRNGIIDTLQETYYITGQNGTDTLKLFY